MMGITINEMDCFNPPKIHAMDDLKNAM